MPDEDGNALSIGEVWTQIENVHRILHTLDYGPEAPTMTIALTEADVLLICAALPSLEISYPCLHDNSATLQARIIELQRAQLPDWKYFGTEAE